jgi:hypothetical protein
MAKDKTMNPDSLRTTEELHILAMEAGYPLPPLDDYPHSMETFKQWLRNNHNLHITLNLDEGWFYLILFITEDKIDSFKTQQVTTFLHHETYEQALAAGLKEAFKFLIRNK